MTEGDPPGPAARTARQFLLPAVTICWIVAIVLAYYVVHKPLTSQQAAAIGRLMLTLGTWVGSLSLCYWLGRLAVPGLRRFILREQFVLRLGFGLGVLSLLMLGLGAVRGYWPMLAWAFLLLALPPTIRQFLREGWRARPAMPSDWSDRLLSLFVLATLGFAFLRALSPPTAWDALVYHLMGPKLDIQAHGLVHNLDLAYLGFPQGGSMLFTWAMLLTGPELAQLFHFTFALLTIALLAGVARRLAPGRGWLASALLLGVPSAALLAGWAYVDWIPMFAALAAFVVLGEATSEDAGGSRFDAQGHREMSAADNDSAGHLALAAQAGRNSGTHTESMERQPLDEGRRVDPGSAAMSNNPASRTAAVRSWLGSLSGVFHSPWVLAAFFAAQAFASKYTAVGIVLGLAIFLAVRSRSLRRVAGFGFFFGVFVAPFLARNLILTGNPVYPFFLPGAFWDALRGYWYSRPGTGLGLARVLVAPIEATLFGVEGGIVEGHPPYSATTGPLLLALLPFVFLEWRHRSPETRRWAKGLLIVSFVTYGAWLAELAYSNLLVQTRLLFPIFPMLAALAGLGFDSLRSVSQKGFSVQFVAGGLVGFVLALTLLSSSLSFIRSSPLRVLTGSESTQDYLVSQLGVYSLAMDEVSQLPEGSRIVFLWEPRAYWCSGAAQCEPDALLDRWWHLRRLGFDAQSAAQHWKHEGITHVLLFNQGAQEIKRARFDPLSEQDWQELDRLTEHELTEIKDWDGVYVLYKLP